LPSCPDKYPLPIPMFLRNTLDVRDKSRETAKTNLVYNESDHNYMDVFRLNRDDHILLNHKKLDK
jgi:hypothetical protein